jgi:hypothetical protein
MRLSFVPSRLSTFVVRKSKERLFVRCMAQDIEPTSHCLKLVPPQKRSLVLLITSSKINVAGTQDDFVLGYHGAVLGKHKILRREKADLLNEILPSTAA